MPWTTNYYHADALGSTRALTDDGEAVTDRYVYDAFGNQRQATGSTVNPFRYVGLVGYYYDEDSGDYYVRARYYNPRIIRWLSVDPIGFDAGDPNFYNYTGNNSMRAVDPSGLLIKYPAVCLSARAHPVAGACLLSFEVGLLIGSCCVKLSGDRIERNHDPERFRIIERTQRLKENRPRPGCRARHPNWPACPYDIKESPEFVASTWLRTAACKNNDRVVVRTCIEIPNLRPACGVGGGKQMHCLITEGRRQLPQRVSVRCCNCCSTGRESYERVNCIEQHVHWSDGVRPKIPPECC